MSDWKKVSGTIPAGARVEYRLVPMSPDNVDQIAEIEQECFSKPWSKRMLLEELEDLSASFIAAQTPDGKVLGYAGLTVVLDEGYINNIAVRKEYRRSGVATALLDVFLRFGKEKKLSFLTLEVRASNDAAIALYAKYGFEEVGRRRNYYEDPREDALLMTHNFERVEA
jgi:ribosomal-protein-alanine N-acetyltransferase